MSRAWRVWLTAAGLLVGPVAASPAAHFDYLYVEANEGGSSGGHAAVRFGDRTYHFQNRAGRLVLDREQTSDFFHAYALLSNRTIQLQRIELSEADRARALGQFNRRHHAQDRQLDVLDALGEDRALLEAWQRGETGPGVRALGYFDLGAGAPASAGVERLAARIRERLGDDFQRGRRRAAVSTLERASADDPGAWTVDPPDGIYAEPGFALPFARRHEAAEASLAALFVLDRRAPLRGGTTWHPTGPSWWLSPAELERLDAEMRLLEDQLVRLAGSEREDWGRPFLIGLARLLALQETRRDGRFVFLDAFPDDARRLDAGILGRRLDVVARMARAGHREVEDARARWIGDEPGSERAWARVEAAANRVIELETAVREGRDLRIVRGALLPSKRATRPGARPVERDDLAERLAAVRTREDAYRDALDGLYRYKLISRSCVSELFHTLDDAFEDSVPEIERALGGHVDGSAGLAFIPFRSAAAVNERYRVTERHELPSWRELQLAEMRRTESPLLVALRESNTLTARSYRKGHQDSWFLFFTDDALPLRPVLGVFNLLAGVGESLWGVVRLPFDGGDALVSGLEGSLASLPELAFFNIRKGSNDWVERRPRDPAR